jgi:hypothetical protein
VKAGSPAVGRLRRVKLVLVVLMAIIAFPVTIAIMFAASSEGRR